MSPSALTAESGLKSWVPMIPSPTTEFQMRQEKRTPVTTEVKWELGACSSRQQVGGFYYQAKAGRDADSSLCPVACCAESQQQGRNSVEGIREVSHGFLDIHRHMGHRCVFLVLDASICCPLPVNSLVLCTYISFCGYEPRIKCFSKQSLWFDDMGKEPAVLGERQMTRRVVCFNQRSLIFSF